MKSIHRLLILGFLSIICINETAMAIPTLVTVTVRAKDAKFIGSSMSGALITIRNFETGELLVKGITTGTTGDTEKMMEKPLKRGVPLSDDKSARFNATLDIVEPTHVEIRAYGPLGQRQSANTVSVTQWIIPGKHVNTGDGVLLDMPGLSVDILAPPAHLQLSKNNLPRKIALRANVIMMCGCPLTPRGIWDANRYEVRALVKKNGKPNGEIPLSYGGEPSQFAGTLELTEEGIYEVTVYAYDHSSGNTGVDTTTLLVDDF